MLPEAFARDPERLARFEREAQRPRLAQPPEHRRRSTASRTSERRRALVHGARRGRGPRRAARSAGAIPLDEALAIARQIADGARGGAREGDRPPRPQAREHQADAGRQGEGPRLRPRQGARRRQAPASSSAARSNSPTMTPRGDARRASSSAPPPTCRPSRRAGRPVDKRADIWAFGVVLYEMLTGSAPLRRRDGLRRRSPRC